MLVMPSPTYDGVNAGGQHVSATGPFVDWYPSPTGGWHLRAGLLFAAGLHPTGLGEAFVVVQIVTVLAFAELEFTGLRRALSLPRATRTHHA